MNREEARADLDASTLRPYDAADEALELAQTDAELGRWLEHRTAFDERVAAAMDEMPVPAGLPSQLLAAMNAEVAKQRRPFLARPTVWLAAAAVLVLMFAGWWMTQPEGPDWQSQALAKVKLIDHGLMRLDHRSPKLEELRKTLVSAGSLSPGKLPASLEKLRTFGCKVIDVAGKPATVVCFQIAPGEEAHLVIMAQGSLPNLPSQLQPEFTQQGDWRLASWSDGTRSLVLMTRASEDKLRALFAVVQSETNRSGRTA